MVEFIKYCLYCFGVAIAASQGYNPEGVTFKMLAVGIATMFVLLGLGFLLLYILAWVICFFRWVWWVFKRPEPDPTLTDPKYNRF